MKRTFQFVISILVILLIASCIVCAAEEMETPEDTTCEDELVGVVPALSQSIILDHYSLTLKRGEMAKITATNRISSDEIGWYSSNSSVAEVSQDGYVRAISSGTVTISAWLPFPISGYEQSASCTVTVSSDKIIENGEYCLCNGELRSYLSDDSNASDGDYFWMEDHLNKVGKLWRFTLGIDGYYTIRSTLTNQFLSLNSASISEGTSIVHSSSNFTSGEKWSVIQTGDRLYSFVPKNCSDASVLLSVSEVEDGFLLVINETEDDYPMLTQWRLTRSQPTSGYEIESVASAWIRAHTSYQYAMNFHISPLFPYTELYYQYEGSISNYWYNHDYGVSNDNIVLAVLADLMIFNLNASDQYFDYYQVDQYEQCDEGTYKVALTTDDHGNYRWYKQDPDGYWSFLDDDETIDNPVKYTDANHDYILDPQYASRGSFRTFLGYYAVTPLVIHD